MNAHDGFRYIPFCKFVDFIVKSSLNKKPGNYGIFFFCVVNKCVDFSLNGTSSNEKYSRGKVNTFNLSFYELF